MHFINQAEKILVFSPGVELKWASQESDDFQSWCKGGGEGGRAHILDRGRSDGIEDKVSPPSCWIGLSLLLCDLFCLKKHCFLTVLWEILSVPMLELLFYIGDYKSLTGALSTSCAI